jgi:ABC-type nitrate/sulfonate/bicarbonate transport system substrate-binding protein
LQVGTVVDRPVPTTAIVTSKAALADRAEVLTRFTRALRQGIRLYHEQPETVSAAIATFFGLDLAEHRAEVDDTRLHYAGLYPDPPTPPLEGYRQLLGDLTETNPRAVDFRVEDLVDERFVR